MRHEDAALLRCPAPPVQQGAAVVSDTGGTEEEEDRKQQFQHILTPQLKH